MIIGLTGGIASGKSTAAKFLADQGAHMIDADKLGHRAYLKGTSAYQQVIETFGPDVIGEDGEIDRKVLGAKVFGEGNRLDELTAIVWPAIAGLAREEIAAVHAADAHKIIVLEAAVLIEAQWQDLVDQIWVCVVDPDVAIARACERDGVDADAVKARIDAQLSNAERIEHADQVIDNSGSPDDLEAQLIALWGRLTAGTHHDS